MSEHTELGRKGEIVAVEYFVKKGFKILHTNWRYRKLEIDIVASNNKTLVIVEVKSRSNDYFESPKDAITFAKQKNLYNAAEYYTEIYDIDLEIQFDIVSIVFENGKHKLEHIEDAFRPGW